MPIAGLLTFALGPIGRWVLGTVGVLLVIGIVADRLTQRGIRICEARHTAALAKELRRQQVEAEQRTRALIEAERTTQKALEESLDDQKRKLAALEAAARSADPKCVSDEWLRVLKGEAARAKPDGRAAR